MRSQRLTLITFLDLSDVGLVIERIGGGRRA